MAARKHGTFSGPGALTVTIAAPTDVVVGPRTRDYKVLGVTVIPRGPVDIFFTKNNAVPTVSGDDTHVSPAGMPTTVMLDDPVESLDVKLIAAQPVDYTVEAVWGES